MSLGTAFIIVGCDGACGEALELDLTPLADGGWDARKVPIQLRRAQWLTDGDQHYCSDCTEARQEHAQRADDRAADVDAERLADGPVTGHTDLW